MHTIKKLSIYDFNPRYFKDYSGNGIGDLQGISQKFDYFKYLGVDTIILQDILSSNSNDNIQNYTSVAKEIGEINDLILVLSHAKKHGINVLLEMNIGSIKENHNWFEIAADNVGVKNNLIDFSPTKEEVGSPETAYSKNAKAYYSIIDETKEIPLNWESDKLIEKFVEVIRFWSNLGISGFVFKDFEFIGDKSRTNSMNELTLKELRKFYRSIKEVNDNIIIIGKSSIIETNVSDRYTYGVTKVFDYFQSTKISMLGTSHRHGIDAIGKFMTNDLVSILKNFSNKPTNIVSFGSENVGRFISRWGDDGQYIRESSKAFAMVQFLTPASSSIYYADELGASNIGLTHLDDFKDENLEVRKEAWLDQGRKLNSFMDAQILQNPINARSLMMWNSSKNGGFSTSDRTVTPPSIDYSDNNTEIQFNDDASTLNFYKKLNEFTKNSIYSSIIRNGNWKIKSSLISRGVVKMISALDNKEIISFINLTDSVRKINVKQGKIVLSTYANKEYPELPIKLSAYEGIVVSRFTDDFIKETQLVKKNKLKEKENFENNMAKEEQKVAEIKKINELNAEIRKQKALEEENRIIKEKVAFDIEQISKSKDKQKMVKENHIDKNMIQKKTNSIDSNEDNQNLEHNNGNELNNTESPAMKELHNSDFNNNDHMIDHNADISQKSEIDNKSNLKKLVKTEMNEISSFENDNSIMDEEVGPDDITTLTESELAATTQIDIDEIDDIEEFLKNSK